MSTSEIPLHTPNEQQEGFSTEAPAAQGGRTDGMEGDR